MTTPSRTRTSSLSKTFIPIAVLLALILGALSFIKMKVSPNQSSQVSIDVNEGSILPDFTLTKQDGSQIQLSKIPGKLFMINFWATWCEACVTEMPSIVELWKDYKDRGFEVLGVNLDENPEAVIPKIASQLKIEFPIYVDPEGKTADLFDVHAIPLTVLFNEKREILFIKNGEKDWNAPKFRAQMEEWLGK